MLIFCVPFIFRNIILIFKIIKYKYITLLLLCTLLACIIVYYFCFINFIVVYISTLRTIIRVTQQCA